LPQYSAEDRSVIFVTISAVQFINIIQYLKSESAMQKLISQ